MSNEAGVRRLLVATTNLDRSSRTDRELLSQFVDGGDECAFEALVKRHTNLVLGVCRRSLAKGQDAEDACQAVFLLLAENANTERWQASIANWLYSTARKVSRNARLAAERRVKHEGRAGQAAVSKSVSPIDQMTGRELLAALDDELERLPAIYREPLVLCHLEGLTRSEVATRLGVEPGTIKIRLERGRRKLADALTKRGIDFGACLIAIATTASARALSPQLVESILATVGGSPSASLAAIAKGIAMNNFSLKAKLLAFVAIAATVTGFGIASMQTDAGTQKPAIARMTQPATKDEAKSNDKPKVEQPMAKANEPPKFKPIDSETIAAFEKLGAKYGGFEVRFFRFRPFLPSNQAMETQLPGFWLVWQGNGSFPNLPPVHVPFGMSLNGSALTNSELKQVKLKEVKNLTFLNLSGTKITDTGLKELKELKNLTSLDLQNTEVTDAGLKELKELKNLTALFLNLRQVTDAGLKELKDLKNLTALYLKDAQVTDVGLKELKGLKNLADLSLYGCTQVTDAGLKELKDLENLLSLLLADTQITDAGLKELKDLKNLICLNVRGTKVTGVGLTELKDLKNLTYLGLELTEVTDQGLKDLKSFKNLTSLDLRGTKVTDTGLKNLKDLTGLTSLILEKTQVTDAGLKELKVLKNLEWISLNDTKVTGVGLTELKDLKKLTALHLELTEVTDQDLKDLKSFKNLTFLDLRGTKVTDTGLKNLKDLTGLTSLILEKTQVTDAGLKELKVLKNLESIRLRDTKVTFAGEKELQEALPKCHISR